MTSNKVIGWILKLYLIFSILAVYSQLVIGVRDFLGILGSGVGPFSLLFLIMIFFFVTGALGLIIIKLVFNWEEDLSTHFVGILVLALVSLAFGFWVSIATWPRFGAVFHGLEWGFWYGPAFILSPLPGVILILLAFAVRKEK